LVKSYSRIGDVVLDNTTGSGSTGVAFVNTTRAFIGIELTDEWYPKAHDRIRSAWLGQLHEELDEEPEKTLTVDDVDFSKVKVEVDPTKLPKNFKQFYESLDFDHMDYETVQEVVVKYMNMYYCIRRTDKLVSVFASVPAMSKYQVIYRRAKYDDGTDAGEVAGAQINHASGTYESLVASFAT